MPLFETPRLTVRRLTLADAPLVLALVNEPGWLENIGDRNVHSLADAEAYLRTGPLASYDQHGHGLYHVALRDTGQPLGLCGLLQRETLDAPDLGYAILARHAGRGYATEAARATLAHARRDLAMARVLATTKPTNRASQRVLEKAGMARQETIEMPGHPGPTALFAIDLGAFPDSGS